MSEGSPPWSPVYFDGAVFIFHFPFLVFHFAHRLSLRFCLKILPVNNWTAILPQHGSCVFAAFLSVRHGAQRVGKVEIRTPLTIRGSNPMPPSRLRPRSLPLKSKIIQNKSCEATRFSAAPTWFIVSRVPPLVVVQINEKDAEALSLRSTVGSLPR